MNAAGEIALLCFRVGETLFAIDVMRIREIIAPRSISSPPADSPFLEGSVTLRSAVIPVMSLARRFGIPPAGREGSGELIVVRLPGTVLALAVDQVLEVISVPADRILPPADGEGVGSDFVLGSCNSGPDPVMILDIDLLHAATPLRQA